ncbi:sulfatase-like hydrolase/transferase [Aequorivita sp. F47161]|uniref:Sulfatase-like hydrolase/transferase n=1 Tax=Aequorivita vitellina TaxID=2874475 RepID=A0A9X1QXB4_9FLAO|nr:sulfatase-like hydrolase/transferase [Aequorivita vitellina]MCG2419596.1 sulfatase-like hydrolase/transferase [Aequorivita vitellina]
MKPKSSFLKKHFQNISKSPIVIALGVGLYPLVFYYSRNFGMINSWEQFGYFILLFLLLPTVFFAVLTQVSKLSFAAKWKKYLLPFFSVFLFLFYVKIILYADIQRKIILGIFILSVLVAYFLHKHFKKWIFLQLILAVIGFIGLVPTLLKYLNYSSNWTQQPDNIETVVFKKKPNIYYIQPDGYASFSEMQSDFYQVDNSDFNNFLAENGFKNYSNFRSNYITTISSNSATFMMKHHYYDNGKDYSEMLNARKNIITENPVLSIFKNNGYKTHFITEHPYLMVNRPKVGFNYTNFDYSEIPYISTGFKVKREVFPDLEKAIAAKNEDGNFFFIEIFEPSHVSTTKAASKGKETERKEWIDRLQVANAKIKKMVNLISEKDPEALIMIMADHGGFVGLDYTLQVYTKTSNPEIIYTTFGAMLAIKWPNGEAPEIDSHLKSCVNTFRILFSYLGDDNKYLEHLQEDSSYLILKDGTEAGVYKYIDENGNIIFSKL